MLTVGKIQTFYTTLKFSKIYLILIPVRIAHLFPVGCPLIDRWMPITVPVDMKPKKYFATKYYSYLIIIQVNITYYTESSIVYHLVY